MNPLKRRFTDFELEVLDFYDLGISKFKRLELKVYFLGDDSLQNRSQQAPGVIFLSLGAILLLRAA